ncbi:hypothetical protein Krac_9621 [Ktedonobacter racemifer DSM 44963]|uniref:Uncharacterized protein n=1 Tax=Ktedonobacter racemifer DSM 44963 TaxID=485913 RepID=D6TCU4_KTERA|nr:hypothetical protein Krac_9621 [Ktedonobacter racemifer DSM 44963]
MQISPAQCWDLQRRDLMRPFSDEPMPGENDNTMTL